MTVMCTGPMVGLRGGAGGREAEARPWWCARGAENSCWVVRADRGARRILVARPQTVPEIVRIDIRVSYFSPYVLVVIIASTVRTRIYTYIYLQCMYIQTRLVGGRQL